MKPKKLNKNLLLNKKTIADLNNKEMNVVYGGAVTNSLGIDCDTGCPCLTRIYVTCLSGCVTCTGNPQCAEC
jgi:natural product precursor